MGLLGHILSKRTGVSFDRLVKDRILNVLVMDSTGTGVNASGISFPEDIKSRFTKGHIIGKKSQFGIHTGSNSVGRRHVFYNR